MIAQENVYRWSHEIRACIHSHTYIFIYIYIYVDITVHIQNQAWPLNWRYSQVGGPSFPESFDEHEAGAPEAQEMQRVLDISSFLES